MNSPVLMGARLMGDCRDDRPGWATIRANSGNSQRLRHQSLHGFYVLCRSDVVRVRGLYIHQGQVGLGLAQHAVRVPTAGDKEHLMIFSQGYDRNREQVPTSAPDHGPR